MLGAVLLGIIVLFVSCGGDDKTNDKAKGPASSSYPTPAPGSSGSSSPDPDDTFVDGSSNGGPALPDPSELASRSAGTANGTVTSGPAVAPTLPGTGTATGTGTGSNTNVTAPTDGTCADSEMSVTPIPARTTLKRGDAVDILFKIKNIGTRTCTRDVGAGPQELYIDNGAYKYWSSDMCNPAKDSDVRPFQAGIESEYKVTWNGRQSNKCAGIVAAGPNPPPGQFELRARLGTLVSNPVQLTIVN